MSVFRGSAWQYNEVRGQFYLHQFLVEQPDLNFRNYDVLQDMMHVLAFWMSLGVDGFRMDAVAFIWEDANLADEPLSGFVDDPNDYRYLNHTYTNNLPGTLDILGQFFTEIHLYTFLDGRDRITMLEVESFPKLTPEQLQPYFWVGDFPFNFELLFYEDNAVKADDVLHRIQTALNNTPVGRKSNWVVSTMYVQLHTYVIPFVN